MWISNCSNVQFCTRNHSLSTTLKSMPLYFCWICGWKLLMEIHAEKAESIIALVSCWWTWKLPVAVVADVARPMKWSSVNSRWLHNSRTAVASRGWTYVHAPIFFGSSWPTIFPLELNLPSELSIKIMISLELIWYCLAKKNHFMCKRSMTGQFSNDWNKFILDSLSIPEFSAFPVLIPWT